MHEMRNMEQQTFLDIENLEYFSIEESAKILGVSSATIRNWVKTGYLEIISKGKISRNSVENFDKKISGVEKLNQRANKSKKDNHNHEYLAAEFLRKIDLGIEKIDSMGDLYESGLSDSYRNKEGIYYTPSYIVNDLLSLKNQLTGDETFCDPCCGSGNFLVRALEIGFKPENIFGFDTDHVAVEIAKRRILEKTGYKSNNIKCYDFLHLSVSEKAGSYDYIFTNPPWGKKIEQAEKKSISKILKGGSSIDTCSLFYFCCIKSLNLGGTLGLLLPESFFNVATYEDARLSALMLQIQRLSHYGKPFKGILTGAVGMVISKKDSILDQNIDCVYKDKNFKRNVDSFRKNPKSIFNISCTDDEAKVIEHVYSIPYVTLRGRAQWGIGIVTGNNKKYVDNILKDGLIPVYKGSDITKYGLKPASTYIPKDFSLYQQVAPINLYEAPEKLIYKFISSNLCFFYDTESRFVINSANILITEKEFPVSMKVICELFNSDFMNWIFRKLFNTHKVLRGDLELLPIHDQFLSGKNFIESEYLTSINVERTNCGTFRIKK